MKLHLLLMLVLFMQFTSVVNDDDEFILTRLQYEGGWGDPCCGKMPFTDYPSMDETFVRMVERVTNVKAGFASVRPTKEVYKYPFLYVVEPSVMKLTNLEVDTLREYFNRGGFMLMDDFHGEHELNLVKEQLLKLFPGRQLIELSTDHELFHVFYDIDALEETLVISLAYDRTVSHEDNCETCWVPQVFAILDADGGIDVLIAYNFDLGDALEHADNELYSQKMTTFAMRFLINVVIYVMSH